MSTSSSSAQKASMAPTLTSTAISTPPTSTTTTSATHPQQSTQQPTTPIATATATTTTTSTTTATTRTMQSDEDFNIRFVNLVRAHKCLYDKKVPEYRNRDNQEKAWSLISQETRESVIHCKERWRNLRACLSRYIKQQSGSDPQHKPYYLTEHMSFLLPFLKSTRNSLDHRHSVSLSDSLAASLFQQVAHTTATHLVPQPYLQFVNGHQTHQHHHDHHKMEIKHSLSENDEETIDAFDPAVTGASPPLSDTASANTLQNFIPDVQIAELSTPDPVVTCPNVPYDAAASTQAHSSGGSGSVIGNNASVVHHEHNEFPAEPKRIKTEVTTTSGQLHLFGEENTDMEFFRSILPDIATLTPQQKRKFKIGVLELIDDVVERYPHAPTERSLGSRLQPSSTRDWRQ